MTEQDRRRFLKTMGAAAVGAGALATTGRATAPVENSPPGDDVPSLDAIAKLMSETPSEEVFDEAVRLTRLGATHRDLLGGVFLAGIHDIKPDPLGFQFHTVLMGSSAYQVAELGQPEDRLLPALFNLDDFKKAQATDIRRSGDWHLPPRNRSFGEMADSGAEFKNAMDAWDEERSDEAAAQMFQSMDLDTAFELIWPYAGRDQASIGHKTIFASHCYRTLQQIGWRHAEPVLRSLVRGLNLGGDGNRSSSTFDPNRRAAEKIRDDWVVGEEDPSASSKLLAKLRTCTPEEASAMVVDLLNEGAAASSMWDGLRLYAFEMLMQRPGIVPLHAVTSLNAMHYGFTATRKDETKRLLLLQAASFLTMFRGENVRRTGEGGGDGIDSLKPSGKASSAEVFQVATEDKERAAGLIMGSCEDPDFLTAYSNETRRLLVRKATGHHDYKFAAAALEEWEHCHPAWAPHVRAAGMFWLKTAGQNDGSVYRRAKPLLTRG